MVPKRILVLGGGFAGLWATLGVETRAGADVVSLGREGLRLGSGEEIPAVAVVQAPLATYGESGS
ncbi:hypothetical protein [Singulisphaera sp. PoT]|uniref:hypothetical protein n=1 Tax=Singulisphaera sp. PoT TaxID=3411797 RepID=UPI003BF4A80B